MKTSRKNAHDDKYKFYHSPAWVKLSKLFLSSKNYICERCGQPAVLVHHKTRLTSQNLTDTSISLNPENLEALCLACHNQEHWHSGSAVADGLKFTSDGDVKRIA